ncbi:acyl-CoA dehydrogenase family protein [Catenulispora rubra]|uniref:acyl-CoA dehydrogenase family protein n=1 Tax=Catenulispora rubra TaxID=280293 RepID=UPI002B26B88B|nr:acyl-CoA dehydrogenase family protein [Catenulispora rubra]
MNQFSAMVEQVAPVLRANAALCDEESAFPVASMAALRESGLMGLLVPHEYGGLGGDLAAFVEVSQKLSTQCLSTGQIWAMHCFQVDAIARHGTSELAAAVLPAVADGRCYIASVTSERGRKADLFSAASPLRADGDSLLIERSAPVVTGGAHADGYLITMRAAEDAAESEVSFVYADRADLVCEVTSGWNALGMRATDSIGMELKGRVPATNLVGGPGGFGEVARQSMVPLSHLGWSACWLGAARGAFEGLTRFAAKRGADSRTDLFYERLGRVRIDLELLSAYLRRVREEVELARVDGTRLDHPRIRLQLNTLKITAAELSFQAAHRMMQIAGLRAGYLKDSELGIERLFRDLRSAALNHADDTMTVGVGALSLLDRGVTLI